MPAPSLFQLSKQTAIKHIDRINDVGELPYKVVSCVLRKITSPRQLRQIELASPQILGEDGELWMAFMKRDIPQYELYLETPRDPRDWHKVYMKAKKASEEEMLREAEKLKASMESIRSEKEKNTSRFLPPSSLPPGPSKRRGRASATAGTSAFRSGSGANFLEKARKEVQGRNIFGVRNQLMSQSTDPRRQQQQQQQRGVGKAGKAAVPSSSTTVARSIQSSSISANSTSRSGAISDETRSTNELPSCLRRAPPPRALASAGNIAVGTQPKAISSQAVSSSNHSKVGRGSQSSSATTAATAAMAGPASLPPDSTRATALAQSRAAASAERAARVAEAQERRQRALAAVAGNPFQVPSLPSLPPPVPSTSSTLPPGSSSSVSASSVATSAGSKKAVAGSKRDVDGNVVIRRDDGRTKISASASGGGVSDVQPKSKSRRKLI